jgi:glucose/arabinose dehydrogenase
VAACLGKKRATGALGLIISALMVAVPIVASDAHPAGAGVPSGFASSLILGGLDAGPGGNPVAFAFAPDGRVFVARKAGIVDVWDGGVRHVYLDIRSEVNSVQSRGLLAVAVDPAYATNKRVFAMFTQELDPANPDQDGPAGGKIIRVSAQAANPDAADPATRVTLLSGFASNSREHTVGGLRFDVQGHLLATLGDAADPGINNGEALAALNLGDLRGKLIRIDRNTGAGVAGNPYFDAAQAGSVRSKVYVRGLRNAYRFTVDPDNGTLYVGDVGWNTWEMLNDFPVATSNPDKDRNAGWPCYEGGVSVALPQPDFQFAPVSQSTCAALYPPAQGGTGIGVADPLYGYRHDEPGGENGSAITAGPKYAGTSNYPAQYVGRVFIGDYARDRFQTVDPGTGAASNFGTPGGWGNPVDIQIGPDGNVTYLAIGTAELREIVYRGTNHVPVAVATADRTRSATAPLTVSFTGHNSSDLDPGDILTYDWDFKDGTPHATTADVSHKFVAAGSYDVTLTVSDGHPGGTVSTDLWIDVANTPPTVSLASPSPSFRYSIGNTINLTIAAHDAEDGTLSGNRVFTQVRLIHLGHFHPAKDFYGTSASLTADDHDSDDTFYEVISTATDSFGRPTTTTTDILPNKTTVTLSSSPSGATVSLDGVQRMTPYSWPSIVGGHHEVDAPADLFTGGKPYAFDLWSQGTTIGTQQFFSFDTPAGGTTLNAKYAPTTPGLSISDASIAEGATGNRSVTVDVSLSTVPTAAVTVDYTTQDGAGSQGATAGSDYIAKSGTVSFAAGVSTQSIAVNVIGDTVVEADEHFGLQLLNAHGAPIVAGTASVTILDDDPSTGLRLSVGDVKILEGNGGTPSATLTVSLSAPSPGGVTVDYATSNGTATAPTDYTAKSGTITLAAGKTSKAVAIPIKGDGSFETSETLAFLLTNPVGAVIGRAAGTVRIANDDAGPALAVSDASMVEGDSGTPFITFSLALSTPSTKTVAVAYTVSHTTTNGGDLQVKSGTASIPAGQLSQSVQVKTFADASTEPNETFALVLSNPINAALADPTGVGTILNDDPGSGRRIGIGDAAINEGNAGNRLLRFTVSLSSLSATEVTVSYATGGGTAIAGTDYIAKSGTVQISAGKTSAIVAIAVKGNAVPTSAKTFGITLSNPSAGVTVGRATATGTIRNDD